MRISKLFSYVQVSVERTLSKDCVSTFHIYRKEQKVMYTHKFVKLVVLAVVATAIVISGIQLTATSAEAHTKCKVSLPLGGWTEGCPHFHAPEPQDSCLASYTNTFYEFRISNATGNAINYSINGESFSLSDGYGRNHQYQRAYGSNSCNTKYYTNPVIRFDYSYASGFQERSYKVGDYAKETFKQAGNGIDLYH